MVGVPVVAADTDAEAEYLATSALQRGLRLIRRQPIFVPPPVKSMDGLWTEQERFLVQSRMGVAAVGGSDTVRLKLEKLAEDRSADEFIFVSDLYEHGARLRSFEITSGLKEKLFEPLMNLARRSRNQ